MQNIFTKEITSKRTIKATLIAVGIGIGFVLFGGVMLLSLYLGDKYIHDVFYTEIFQEPIWHLFLSLTFVTTSLLGIWLVFKVKKLKDNNKSFTLIELLVVIAIIGVIAAIVVINMSGATDEAKIVKGQAFSAKIGIELADSVVSKWNFDEGTGSTANDAWGVNSGTLNNFDFNDASGWRSGGDCVSGSCLEFDGVNDYVGMGTWDLTGEARTVSLWIKSTDAPSSLTDKRFFSANYYEIRFNAGTLTSRIYDSTFRTLTYDISSLNADTWYYIVVTSDTNSLVLYVDGVSVDTNNVFTLTTHPYNLNIGANYAGTLRFFSGMLDEVLIYNSAADLAQIQSNYLAGLQKLLSKGAISQEEYNQRVKKIVLE